MSTLAHQVIKELAAAWEKIYASAVLSGIVGDAAHQARGGYHISIEDQSSTNYSVTRPDDKAPPGDWPRNLAAAIDMSMNTADMTTCSSRLWDVWNDTSDPRHNYINGFNGWFGSGDAKRYDFVTQAISTTTSDHKWHVHLEIRRRWVTSTDAAKAIISILRGETKQQFLQSLGGDDMFCNFGEKNDKVKAMQLQLLQLDPNCLPQFGADSDFGGETQAALSRLVTGGEPIYYGPDAWSQLQKLVAEKFGPSGSSSPITWPLHGTATTNETSITFTVPPSTFDVVINEQK